ncbi:MAG TPA: dihydrofolate reductase family protein [Kofleriaceae bacterium]|nr:dihydrofolate reductase family protein [Kofleriaceae bacterium]
MSDAPVARPQGCVFIAQSLDGYIARPDGAIDWLLPFQDTGEDAGFDAFLATIDVLLMGRNTYDTVLGFGGAWPFAGKQVVVLTHRPPTPVADETFAHGEPAAVMARLGQAGARRVYVDGGDVIRQWWAADLLDELTVTTVPLCLGAGLALFGAGGPERALTLASSRAFPSGLLQARYLVPRT